MPNEKEARRLSPAEMVEIMIQRETARTLTRLSTEPLTSNNTISQPTYGAIPRRSYAYMPSLSTVPWTGPLATQYPATTEEAIPAAPPSSVAVMEPPKMDDLKRIEPEPVQESDFSDGMKVLAMEAQQLLGYRRLASAHGLKPRLRLALDKLEISTLDPDSVEAYKAQMVVYATGKIFDPTWKIKPLTSYNDPVPEFVLNKCVSIKKELPESQFWVEELHIDPFMLVVLPRPDIYLGNGSVFPPGYVQTYSENFAYIDVWAEKKFEEML